MVPTLHYGNRVLVWRCCLHRWLHRGRLVVVEHEADRSPSRWPTPDEPALYIKRVVGLPGDKLAVSPREGFRAVREGNEFSDGDGLSDSVADDSHARRVFPMPRGHFFVCGDNQDSSTDSRQWGPLSFRCLQGIVVRKLSKAAAR